MNFHRIKPRTKHIVAKLFAPLMSSVMVEVLFLLNWGEGFRRGHDRIVVGFTTTCAISAYHH